MDKLIICVLLSSLAGSVVYGMWRLVSGKWSKGKDPTVAYVVLHITAVIYVLLLFVGIVYFACVLYLPGTNAWGLSSPALYPVPALLSWIWLFGALMHLGYYKYRYYQHDKRIGLCCECDSQVQDLANQIARQMNIRKNVSVLASPAILTAELGADFSPRIYLPENHYRDEQPVGIITHELVHYRNRDAWIRKIAVLAGCIHWFNPVLRYMRRSLEHWDELYCDYLVCQYTHIEVRQYAETLYFMGLLYADEKEAGRKRFDISVGFLEGKYYLLERVERVLMYNKGETSKRKRITAIAAAMLFVLAGAGTTLAAERTMNRMYYDLVIETVPMVEEELVKIELEEYEVAAEEVPVELQEETPELRAPSEAVISTALGNDTWKSGLFTAYSGQEIFVSISAKPSNVMLKVGIIHPDGKIRYVYSSGNMSHTFELNMTGGYQVFITNETDTKVDVLGHYITDTQ